MVSTIFLTVMSGVLVYVFGEIIIKFFIEPIHKQKELIGKIADVLIFYANIYSNPGMCSKQENDEASDRLRQLAVYIISKTHLIPFYDSFSYLYILPRKEQILDAHKNLIELSNSIHRGDAQKNNNLREEIGKALNIELGLDDSKNKVKTNNKNKEKKN